MSSHERLQSAVDEISVGRYVAAEEIFREVLAAEPLNSHAWTLYGDLLRGARKIGPAIECCKRAVEVKPTADYAACKLYYLLRTALRWAEAEELSAALLHRFDCGGVLTPFELLTVEGQTPALQKTWAERFASFRFPLRRASSTSQHRGHGRKIRVGYVSADWYEHATYYLLKPVLACHNFGDFDIYAYDIGAKRPDGKQAEIEAIGLSYVDLSPFSAEAAAKRISEDGIDVLIDLKGYTGSANPEIFCHRPAPIQVNWLGYPGTLGNRGVWDYLVGDQYVTPESEAHSYSERLVQLPLPYQPNCRNRAGRSAAASSTRVDRGQAIVLACYCQPYKYSPKMLTAWAEIMRQCPRTQLRLLDQPEDGKVRLLRVFTDAGVDSSRILFEPLVGVDDHLARVANADLMLDTYPVVSHTTASDALVQGVPLVTLRGQTFESRVAASLLLHLGLPELVATSFENYKALVVGLVNNAAARTDIAERLARSVQDSPAFDSAHYCRVWEVALRGLCAVGVPAEGSTFKVVDGAQNLTGAMGSYSNKDLKGADRLLTVFVAQNPAHQDGLNLWGAVKLELGQNRESVQLFLRAHSITWRMDVATNLATAYRRAGMTDNALVLFKEVLELHPQHATAHSSVSAAYLDVGEYELARRHTLIALDINPALTDARFNLAVVYEKLGLHGEAFKAYMDCFDNHGGSADALCGAASARHQQFDYLGAIALHQKCEGLAPGLVNNLIGLARSYAQLGMHDEAFRVHQKVFALDPRHQLAWSNYLFAANYSPQLSGDERLELYRKYEQTFALPLKQEWRPHLNEASLGRRLRVGYVYSEFTKHSARSFLLPLLEHHDRSGFELYAYSDVKHEDDVTAHYRTLFDHWVHATGRDDQWLTNRVREDRIDVLVDLAGHTGGNRLLVFARKPAPVSLHWLDYGYTTGLSAIDYYLTDEVTVPAGGDRYFSERPWRLPRIALAYRPISDMGDVSELPASERGYVTFGTLTRAVRINDGVVDAWARILRAVPGSRLVINSRNYASAQFVEETCDRFARLGIERGRLEVGHTSPPWDLLRGIDVGLDCFPHNSGTTLIESLYMGIPFVTLKGTPSIGTLGASILDSVGLNEFIAHDVDQYVSVATSVAADLGWLKVLRSSLRSRVQASAMMDEAGFAREVELAYRKMWKLWCGEAT